MDGLTSDVAEPWEALNTVVANGSFERVISGSLVDSSSVGTDCGTLVMARVDVNCVVRVSASVEGIGAIADDNSGAEIVIVVACSDGKKVVYALVLRKLVLVVCGRDWVVGEYSVWATLDGANDNEAEGADGTNEADETLTP